MDKEEKIEIAKEILKLSAATAVLIGAVIAPPAAGALAKLYYEYKRYSPSKQWQYRSRIRRTIKRLEKKGWLVTESKKEKLVIRITQTGRRWLNRQAIGDLTIKRPIKWDGLWRVSIFDIPESNREIRNTVRSWLKRHGFVELQQSAWVIPWPCVKEVDLLKAEYKLGNQLILLETKMIAKENALSRIFKL